MLIAASRQSQVPGAPETNTEGAHTDKQPASQQRRPLHTSHRKPVLQRDTRKPDPSRGEDHTGVSKQHYLDIKQCLSLSFLGAPDALCTLLLN